tara:strand:+ start:227 stop:382 length:156 start_codon:yes stop_codon:yes gene_type:complete
MKYELLTLQTSGWQLADEDSGNLTKEQCDQKLRDYIGDGISPDRIKVRRVA